MDNRAIEDLDDERTRARKNKTWDLRTFKKKKLVVMK